MLVLVLVEWEAAEELQFCSESLTIPMLVGDSADVGKEVDEEVGTVAVAVTAVAAV